MDLSRDVKDPFIDCQWISSQTFEGYIKNYLPWKGRGNYRYINGDQVYFGEWTHGKIHRGVGILTLDTDIYRDVVFIGGWINGVMSGYVLTIECDIISPEIIDSIRYNIIENDSITLSHEVEKPLTKNTFQSIFNIFRNTIFNETKYRAY